MDRLKGRLAAGESPVGALVRLPAETLVELCGVGGLDFVVIDCEHGPADVIALQNHIVHAHSHGLDVLVRVGRDGRDLALRALDLGAVGLIFPHVDDADAARRAVDASHYPPLGDRGYAQYSRVGKFGSRPAEEQLADARQNTLVVVMIETQSGVDNAEEILAVDGVDVVMAGPADLSVSLGLTGGVQEPTVQEAVNRINGLASRFGLHSLTIVGDIDQARTAPPGLITFNLAGVLLETFTRLGKARGE